MSGSEASIWKPIAEMRQGAGCLAYKLLNEIAELKKGLSQERLRADFYEEMVSFGKEVYGIDLKKAGTK